MRDETSLSSLPPAPPARWDLPKRREVRRRIVVYERDPVLLVGSFRVLGEDEDPEAFALCYTVDIGYVDGRPSEVFADGPKSGMDQEPLLDDACIAISLFLQHGFAPDYLRGRFSRLHHNDAAASALGAIVEAICADQPLYAAEWAASRDATRFFLDRPWKARAPA